MRTPLVALAGSLLLGACVSGTRVVYVPVPADGSPPAASAPAPAPAPQPIQVAPPVAVTIVRADQGRILVSLDQPAYLAVFDITPGRGVTLLYPTSTRQRQVAITGARWLDPRWGTVASYDNGGRYPVSRPSPTHYVYAVASERPLRLSDAAFDDELLANMLGLRATRTADPYDTRDAIVRQFVPVIRDEDWGEDMYAMEAMRPVQTVRVARVYCTDGSVIYVRDEVASRAWCPRNNTARGNAVSNRPDSVVAWNGRPVSQGYDPNTRTPVYRIPRTVGQNAVGQGGNGRQNGGNAGNVANNGNNANNGRGNAANGNQDQGGVQQQGQPQGNGNPQNNNNGNASPQNNGNANGRGNGNGSNNANGNAPSNGNGHNNGNDKPVGNAQGQPHNAQPESQAAPQTDAKPAAPAESNKPAKPASVSDVLKRGKGTAKKAESDSTKKAPTPQ